MLDRIKNRKEEGFTIIEVLIVLAIAGLIMLVVFLAVPALQMSQRNGARRTEGSRIAAAANDSLTNSNGNIPATATDATNILGAANIDSASQLGALTGAAQAAPGTCVAGSAVNGKLTICTGAAVTFTLPSADAAVLATKAQCNGADTIQAGTGRQMAVIYTIEKKGGFNLACVNV